MVNNPRNKAKHREKVRRLTRLAVPRTKKDFVVRIASAGTVGAVVGSGIKYHWSVKKAEKDLMTTQAFLRHTKISPLERELDSLRAEREKVLNFNNPLDPPIDALVEQIEAFIKSKGLTPTTTKVGVNVETNKVDIVLKKPEEFSSLPDNHPKVIQLLAEVDKEVVAPHIGNLLQVSKSMTAERLTAFAQSKQKKLAELSERINETQVKLSNQRQSVANKIQSTKSNQSHLGPIAKGAAVGAGIPSTLIGATVLGTAIVRGIKNIVPRLRRIRRKKSVQELRPVQPKPQTNAALPTITTSRPVRHAAPQVQLVVRSRKRRTPVPEERKTEPRKPHVEPRAVNLNTRIRPVLAEFGNSLTGTNRPLYQANSKEVRRMAISMLQELSVGGRRRNMLHVSLVRMAKTKPHLEGMAYELIKFFKKKEIIRVYDISRGGGGETIQLNFDNSFVIAFSGLGKRRK
ncbi:MAG: hypothetical protein ABIH20_00960 [Candidatus Diapherotrites archaeon]